MRRFYHLIIGFLLIVTLSKATGQTYNYARNNFNIDITLSHPCDGLDNGFINIKVNSTDGGGAILVLIGADFPNQVITTGNTYTYIPAAPQAAVYDFIIRENLVSGADIINTFTPTYDAVELVNLADLTINTVTLTNNSDCTFPNGQVVASISGGSKTPALPVAGSFSYSWTTNNGLSGFPINGTFDGTTTLNLAALKGVSGLPAGTYTLTVDDGYSVCGATADFTIADPSPLSFAVSTATPSVCLGNGGSIQLANSEGAAVNYEVYLNGNPTGINQNGNNGAFSFAIPAGTLGATGTYNFTIRGVNGLCTPAFMTGTASITVVGNPTVSNAGPDQLSLCGVTSTTLAGNSPVVGTGSWSIVSGTGGSFGSSGSPTSSFSGTAGTTYVLRWTISNAPCTASTDDVTITFNQNPTTANAGPDQLTLCGVTSTTLAGNTATVGTGGWSIISGTGGSFGTASSPSSSFSGTAGTTYVLRWTISNAPCTASTDDVTITFNQNPTTSNAGPDQLNLCGVTSTTLAANTPTVGTGGWSVVSGTGGSFGTPSSAASIFTGTLGTTYVLRWTISNAPCTASTDDVTITFNQNPTTANAGPDQLSLCTTSTTLAGNTPTIGTGGWSVVSGTGGSFGTASSPTSTFSGTAGTTYILRWTISNAPCTASTDDVTITFNNPPTTSNAGPDQLNLCGVTNTTLAANTPTVGTGSWSIVSGTGGSFGTVSSPTSTFTGTLGNTYTLRWTISSAPCTPSTDDVTITFNQNPTTSNAGSDQLNLCGVTNTTLAANTPAIGMGAWSVVSGTGGSFGTASSPTSTFSGTAGTTYTLRWTISNAPCTASTDDVTITFNQNPTTANAGPDQLSLCSTSTTLAGNAPTIGTGAWSVVSGAGGSFGTASSPTSTFSGTAGTTYTLRWTISNAPCTASTDDVTITFNNPPTTSNAGPDQLNLCGVTSTTLASNTPTIGTGVWSVVSGTGGSFGTASSSTSTFNGAAGTTYILRWTISSAPCTPSADDVTITFNQNPTTSNAGPDQLNLCGVTSTTLAANAPTIGTGAWSVVSGAGGSFGTASSPTSTFSGTAGTTYTLRWTISSAPCAASSDDVTITFNQNPTVSNAGPDQLSLCGVTSTTLAGNSPVVGTGSWSIVSGTGGSFGASGSPTSSFSGTAGTTYVLRWTISNAPCTASTDDVTITFNQNPTTANAGPDQLTLCGVTSTTLAGNTATVGTGGWSIVSGTGGSFGTASSPSSSFSGTAGTTYVLRWTISNAPCTASTDDVTITFNQNPTTSNAGPYQLNLCGVTSTTLAANTPTVGTGGWSVVSGTGGSFGTPSSAASIFTGTLGTTYVLRWTISNAPCTASTDDVTITYNQNPTTANAGPDQLSLCTTSTTLAGNTPTIGTGGWSVVSGTGGSFGTVSSPTSTFSGTAGTTYILRWTISNAPCTASTDDVTITFNNPPTTSNAGPDQLNLCGVTNTTLAANTPTVGTGSWSIVSGTGGSFGTVSSPTSTFTGTLGNTYTLRWTISSAPCTPSTDDVTITFNQNPTTSNAGSDQLNLCGVTNTTLAANTPAIGMGAWSVVSGTGGSFGTASSPTSTFSGTAGTTYTLRWTISNAPCTASTDDVTITFNQNPTTANAGPDQLSLCSTSTTLAGNAPTIGTGAWSVVSGAGGSFGTVSSPTSTFNGTAGTTYTLRWTISNAPCTASTDDVTITFNNPPTTSNAGPDQLNLCGVTSTTLASNTPTVGTGSWSVVSGTGGSFGAASSPTSTFSGTAGTTYTLRWTISSAPCTPSTDDVTITFNQNPTTSNAGPDQLNLCGVTSTTLAANAPTIGTGAWSVVSGAGGSFGTASSPTSTFSGTAGTTYTLRWTISSAPCAASSDDVTITFNLLPSFTNSVADVTSCVPGNDGSITVTASGGSGSYQYSKDGGVNFQVGNVFNGLSAGNYQILVQDGIGCQSVASSVTVGSPSGLAATINVLDVTCNGGNNGSITISASGGNGSFAYSKDNGANFQPSNSFVGLIEGTYQIVIKDGVGCQFSSTVIVAEPIAVTFTTSTSDITCNGSSDGSITISAVGGDSNYTYSKDGGVNFQGSNVFNSLVPGPYSLQVKDGVGCLSSVVVVTILEPTVVSFTANVVDVTTCSPGNDGSITIIAAGGTGAYEYSNDNGASFQVSNAFTGLSAGAYTVLVRDANSCLSTTSVETVGTPGNVTFTSTDTDITCNGASNGTIAITASGGNGVYTYSKDNGVSFQASSSFTGLAAGTYDVIVKDGLGCLSPVASVVITEPTSVTFSTSKTDASSCGSTDGSITVTPSGGTGQYFASLDNGANFIGPNTTFIFNALSAGAYNIVVRDQSNCQTLPTVINILAPGSLSFSSVNQNVTCFGGNNGSITISASGGSGIYSYSKDNGVNFQASNVFSGLIAATYNIVVNDGSGCQFVGNVVITQPTTISVSAAETDLTCNASADGSIAITASGGTGALQYSINNGGSYQAGSSFTGLSAGSYTVIVQDANNCTSASTPITLTEPIAVTFTSSSSNPTSCALSDGSISLTPSGGNGTYFASIDGGANFTGPSANFTFNSLASGSYNVVVRDGVNCQSAVTNITLNSTGGLSATFSKTDVVCFGGSTGTISISASGGTGLYSYSIDNGANFGSGSLFTGLSANTYSVIARDGLGCTFSGSIAINQTTAVTFTTTQSDVLCNAGNTGSISVMASGGNNLFTYSNNNGSSFQGSNTFGGLVAGSYSVLVRDGNNCSSAVSIVVISEPALLQFTANAVDASTCTPGNDGSITVNASGGNGSYEFSSNGGTSFQTSNSFTGLIAGSYSIVVRDANSCTTSAASVSISTPASPDASFTGLSASYCTNSASASLTPMVTGGTFSGPGISGNVFNPTLAGAGTHNVQYSITVSGCTNTSIQPVIVATSTVDASFTGLSFVYCANATAATLTPATAGGTFSGSGISGNTFTPSAAGTGQHTIQYTVTSGGCTATSSAIVTVLAATDPLCTGSVGTGTCTSVIITPKPSPATCTNSDGRIIFSIKPFIPLVNNTGVTISIVGTSITNQSISRTNFNDSTFNTLPVGTYNYTIEYGDPSCIKTGQVTIDQSGTVGTPVASNIVNPTCAGANTGSVVIDVPGETGNTLEWSIDGVTWTPFICGTAITGLSQGPSPSFQHLVSVRRNSSDPCNGGVLVTMQDVAGAITFSETITNATCANDDGSIQIGAITGGTQPYSYSFDGVALATLPANNTFTALAAGDYDFIVTDANSCSLSRTITVTFPGVVVITPVVLNPDCSGNGLNGAITVTVNSVGNFNVGISSDPLLPPTSFINVTSGGTAVVNFANRTKGTYYITAQSTASLCPVTTAVTISSGPTSVDFVATTNDVLCFEELGTIQLNAITGEAGISYGYEVLSGGNPVKSGAITALEALGPVDIQGLNQGVYQVRLFQNQSACTSPIYSANKSLTIDGPDAVLDTIAVSRSISLPDQPTGLMNIVVEESGQEPYEFKLELIDPLFDEQSMPAIDWTQMNRSNQTLKIEQEAASLFAGTYTLSLSDGFGCVKTFEIVIGVNTDLFIPNIFTPNDDGANEEFYIRNLPENSKVVIADRWGKEIFASNNYQNDWRGGNSPDGIYYYKLIIGSETYSGWVEILRGQ